MPADAITLHCDCGETHDVDTKKDRVECDCGSIYVLTITQLKPLLD